MLTISLLDRHSSRVLQKWQFNNLPVVRVGRAPDNQVVLEDSHISRFHLELRQSGSDYWLLVSHGTNGTFLGGQRINQTLLTDNCVVELAKEGPVLKIETSSTPCTHSGNPPGNMFCIHCGQPMSVERTIRDYLVLRTLGKGGMGTTYLACHPPTEKGKPPQLLVLKEMNADMAKVAKARELFEREARILQNLNHPGIPQFFDFFVEDDKKYLAMELIHGQDLEKRIYERGPVTPKVALEWMMQTCEVLNYIHTQDPPIIHRDIKPANLMVQNVTQKIVVLDFGAVKEIGTQLGTRIGAPDYSAPEQNRGQPVTQSDLYAIGPTLIFLLTGQSPHKYYGRRNHEYRFNLESVPTITPQLRNIIDRVTEPKPANRYQTAEQLKAALADCL